MAKTKLVILALSSVVAAVATHVVVYKKGKLDGQKRNTADAPDEQKAPLQNGVHAQPTAH